VLGVARLAVLLLGAVATGMQTGIVFDDYPGFAHASELLRRSLGPVAMWSAGRQMARAEHRQSACSKRAEPQRY